MNTKRLITLALGSVLLAAPAYLAAQDQDQGSVADAARKAQADRKTAPKAKMTIDNDNLGTLTGTVNVVGEEPAPAGDNKADSEKTPKTVAPGEKAAVKGEAYWREKFAAANKKLTDDAHELDILQREFNLKQQQFYSDPNVALREQNSRKDLDDTQAQIDAKKADVEKDQQAISDLQDALRKSGGDPGWGTEPPNTTGANPGPNPGSNTGSNP